MIETRYHDSITVLQGLSLHGDASVPASPFDRAEWFQLLADAGLTPLIATASDKNSTAALALTEKSGRLTTLRNWYSFTWRQFAPEGDAGNRLLTEIAEKLKLRGHRVTLEPVPNEDGSATRLARAFSEAGWRVEITSCDINYILNIKGRSFGEYWATRPGPLRTILARKAGKVDVSILSDFDPAAWALYEQVYAESWKPAEDYPDMLRAFAQSEAKAGRLRLGFASIDGAPIAAQFWTVESGIAYIHKLAHLDEYRNLSAGTTLSAAMFEHVIDRDKVSLIDFGTGDDPYKADWMEETRARYRIDCINLRSPKSWIDFAKITASRLRSKDEPNLAPEPVAG